MERRLAAIFAADMVGYSRLMEADETGTLARQKRHRAELIEPKVAAHHGRIVKLTGDGMIAEFPSVVEAVQCAVSVQKEMAAREADVTEERRIWYRIAVNLGDVIFDEGDVYGDGVNIAARLEALAEPGGVVVSGTAYDHLKSNVEVEYEDLGERRVKNIATPVRVYRVVPSGTGKAAPPLRQQRRWPVLAIAAFVALLISGGGWWWLQRAEFPPSDPPSVEPVLAKDMALPLPLGPSIAVLPFRHVGDDDGDAYLGSGIAGDVSTDLARFNEIMVISSEATESFDGGIRQAASEFGVQHVLHGEVQKQGNRLRISVGLLDAISGQQVWAERYETEWTHIFDVRNEIAGSVAAIIGSYESPLVAATLAGARRKETKSLTAYELVMLARVHRHRFNKQDNAKAHEFLKRAIELDPLYARAYVGLAWTHAQDIWNLWTPSHEDSLREAMAAAKKAIELDENFADGHWVLGDIYLNMTGQPDKGIASMRRAMALNPNHPDILADYGGFYLPQFLGRADEGVELVKKAMRLSPYYADWYDRALVNALFYAKRPQDAIDASQTVDYPTPFSRIVLAASYGHLGQEEKAREVSATIRSEIPDFSLSAFFEERGTPTDMMAPEAIAYLREGVRKAGLPE